MNRSVLPLLISFAILLVLVLLVSCNPMPENYAAASATVMAAESLSTRSAVSNTIALTMVARDSQATATAGAAKLSVDQTAIALTAQVVQARIEQEKTAVAITAQANQAKIEQEQTVVAITAQAASANIELTREAGRVVMGATQTAEPYQAAHASTEATTQDAQRWTVTLFAVGMALAVVALAFGGAAWMHTRAKVIPRDRLGNAPLVLEGGVIKNPDAMIGPVATTTQQNDWLYNIYRIYQYLRTGKILPVLPPDVQLTEGVLPDQYARLAEANAASRTMAAAFQPALEEKKRKERVELLTRGGVGPGGLFGRPETRVIYQTPDAERLVKAIATKFEGHLLRDTEAIESEVEAPLPASPPREGPPDEDEIRQAKYALGGE